MPTIGPNPALKVAGGWLEPISESQPLAIVIGQGWACDLVLANKRGTFRIYLALLKMTLSLSQDRVDGEISVCEFAAGADVSLPRVEQLRRNHLEPKNETE